MNASCPLRLTTALALALGLAACPGETDDPELCGNGDIDQGEACDGENFNGQTCASQGFTHGDLSCDDACEVHTDGCLDDPCWNYPCEPYGAGPGGVIEDRFFFPANDASMQWTGDDDYVGFGDFYRQNEAHGGDLKGLLVFVTAGWCVYCAEEVRYLGGVADEYRDQGIMVLTVVIEDDYGRQATTEYAQSYAQSKGLTMPTVAGSMPLSFWEQTEDAGAVPFHLFIDLRNMRMMGRLGGMGEAKVLRAGLDELVAGPVWGPTGQRQVSFDCAPGTGTEAEPNGFADTPETAAALPFTLSGALCPPALAEGLMIDEDVIDLGNIAAGTVLDVTMRPTGNTDVIPFFVALRLNSLGTQLLWEQYGPGLMVSSERRHLWVVEESGKHMIAAYDGRLVSGLYYGQNSLPPPNHSCCEGGPDYTYELEVQEATLAATEPALTLGATLSEQLSADGPRVYPFAASAGTSYTFRMSSSNYERVDPYLLLYDPLTETVLDYNDDAGSEDRDAEITWTAPADQEVLLVASYFWAFFRTSPPPYGLSVQ